MRTYVHDGQGTYFRPEAMQVSGLDDEADAALIAGDESVLNSPLVGPTPAFGYDGTGRTFEDFMRVVTLWLPHAEVTESFDGSLVIHTGLRRTDGKLAWVGD